MSYYDMDDFDDRFGAEMDYQEDNKPINRYGDSISKTREALASIGFEEVGAFPFRRRQGPECADVDSHNIVWAKRDSGLIITADTWQWAFEDEPGCNGLWVNGVVPNELCYGRVLNITQLGNNGPAGDNHRAFHKDARAGLLRHIANLSDYALLQWRPDGRNTDWLFVNHPHEFESYNLSIGLDKDARGVVNEASHLNALHFRAQSRFTSNASFENERKLPAWVQEILNTEAYFEYYIKFHAKLDQQEAERISKLSSQ
jgi:hypothetical protein